MQKRYIDIHNVYFEEATIVLEELTDVRLCTQAIHADQNGFYVLSSEEFWDCPGCGRRISGKYKYAPCPYCKWPLTPDP